MLIRFPPRRILVPLDFSPPSNAALQAAESLGALFGSTLELVHVVEPLPSPSAGEMGGAPMTLALAANEARAALPPSRKRLLEAASGYFPGKTRARSLVGPAGATLARLARPKETDLVVMGTHGREGLSRMVFGSVAEEVMSRSRVPVLTVHRGRGSFALKTILCPVNLTPYSAVALSYASLLAQAAGASLTALYVHPPTIWEEDAKGLLASFLRESLGPTALGVEAMVERGDARENIGRMARRGPFDVIVLSSHRRPWSSDAVLGTTAARTLRLSSIPILTVP
jgi:nucleotide-binding universal stress UspA family protein